MSGENENIERIDGESLEVFYWRGQKRYRCPRAWESGARCEYDTYDLTEMRQHLRSPHTRSGAFPKETKVQRTSPIVDEHGENFVVESDLSEAPFHFKEE